MKRWFIVVVCAAVLCSLGGCEKKDAEFEAEIWGGVNPWTHLEFNNDSDNFQFIIVSDRTGGARAGVFADAMRKVNLLQPEFVMCVGDLIEGYTEDEAEVDKQWEEFERLVGILEMPFFYVPGNHDVTNTMMLDKLKERFGRSYYHFKYRDVLFLCLNSEGGQNKHEVSRLGDEQIEYFRKVLDDNRYVRWTLIFVHKPIWEDGNESWSEFERLLEGREYTVFAGHKHQYGKAVRGNRKYIRLATTGGVSGLQGRSVGTFDHVVWVTMTDDGPRVANLMLDGICDENVTSATTANMARLIKDKLDTGEVVRCEPIVVLGGLFSGGKLRMLVNNFGGLTMGLEGRFDCSCDISVSPSEIKESVKPFCSKIIDLKVEAEPPVRVEDLRGCVFEGYISYDVGKGEPMKADARCVIKIKKAGVKADRSLVH